MSVGGFEEFSSTVSKTNELLKIIEAEFGWEEKRNQSYGALRAVLHTLRDRLTVEEAVQLGAQLPMLVRGMYYEGWDVVNVPKKMDKEEFLDSVRRQFPFSIEENIEYLIGVVLSALRKHVSLGEAEDIVAILPKDIAGLMDKFTAVPENGKLEKKPKEEKLEEAMDAEGLGI